MYAMYVFSFLAKKTTKIENLQVIAQKRRENKKIAMERTKLEM